VAETTAVLDGVWADLIGQDRLVAELRRAVAGGSHVMTHAWLFTGPPGSGRSNAAQAFAAALQCERGGCGACNACRTALAGAHPDVTNVRTEAINIGVDEVRELVRKSAMAPTLRRYQVLVVEDADRITDRGADALLKSVEEPSPRTVWLLCAPTAEDVIVTIRSRCRQIGLATPSAAAIAELLRRRDGVGDDLAEWAARVAGGHIGRARALALNEDVRARRAAALAIPARLTSLGECLQLAAELVDAAQGEADSSSKALDAKETAALREALGAKAKGSQPRSTQAALRELADQQKMRAKRLQRDALDRSLTEFTAFFRDVLVSQTAAGVGLVNQELAAEIDAYAGKTAPESTVAKMTAISDCRAVLARNVAPLLAVQSLLISLKV
jgi:DNA polymerase-3 subunit delta'